MENEVKYLIINGNTYTFVTPEELNNAIPTFTVVGTTLVIGNAASIPAAENYSF